MGPDYSGRQGACSLPWSDYQIDILPYEPLVTCSMVRPSNCIFGVGGMDASPKVLSSSSAPKTYRTYRPVTGLKGSNYTLGKEDYFAEPHVTISIALNSFSIQ